MKKSVSTVFMMAVVCLSLAAIEATPADAGLAGKRNEQSTLFVYCAAGMRYVVDSLVHTYEAQHPVKIEMSYDGSNKLLGQMDLTRKGDVYISGDADYVEMARTKGFVASQKTMCYFVPVIMVQKGNPRKVLALSELCTPGFKLGEGDERTSAIGRVTATVLAMNSLDPKAWARNVVLISPTVNDLANAIKLKTIDAAIVWNAVANNYPHDADVVYISRNANVFPEVCAAVLTFSPQRENAAAFLDYLVSPSSRRLLTASGYTVDKP